MENKVYVLWEISGEYDDYRTTIHSVCNTRELAEHWMNRLTTEQKVKMERMDLIDDTHECELPVRDCALCTEKWDLWEETYKEPTYMVEEFILHGELNSNLKGE